MKLFRLVVPIVAGLGMAVGTMTALAYGKAAPAVPPPPLAFETDLAPAAGETASGAENMHADSSGRLWISQDSEGSAYIRVFDPATHAYTDYTGLSSPNDAQLGPDGSVWWSIDTPNSALARMNPATGMVLTWSVPATNTASSLAFDSQNKVWALDSGSSTLFSFAPNSHQLCSLPLPDGNSGNFLTQYNGAFWMGLANVNEFGDSTSAGGLALVTPTTNAYTFWPLSATSPLATPTTRISIAPNGVIWFSDEVSGTIGRLETGANRVTLFTPPGGYTPQQVDYFLGKVWFTGQTDFSGAIGYFDPTTASPTGTTPLVVTPTTAVLSPSCTDAGAGIAFTAGISTGVSVLTPMLLTTTVDAQGVAYVAPNPSQPAGLVRLRTDLWLTDQGRNKLIEVIIPTKDSYLPFVSK